MNFWNKTNCIALIALLLMSCNKEKVSIEGKINGISNSNVEILLKGLNGKEQVIYSDIVMDQGEFHLNLEGQKPPFRMTVKLDSSKSYDMWVFRYGDFNFEIDEKDNILVNSAIENTEYDRICKNYHKMYMDGIEEKKDWVELHEVKSKLSEEEEDKLFDYRDDIKKAYKLRKKSVLSTFRKNPQNRIAIALLFDEYERLTSWQKEECMKTAQKYYSDCGINWQLRN